MNRQSPGPLIFQTRRGAIVALCLGILITFRNLRYLFELYVPGHIWLTRYHFSPDNFNRMLDLWCALLFAGALIYILRRTRRGERVYLTAFLSVAILAPLRDIPATASMHLNTWLETFLELCLIPCAVWMYKTLPPYRARSQAKTLIGR